VLAKLDGRTREARLVRSVRADLTAHVGGHPSATQTALIERAVQLTLRVAAMDRKYARTGAMTDHDTRTYLAWSAGLARLLRALGLDPAKTADAGPRVPTIAEILAEQEREHAR